MKLINKLLDKKIEKKILIAESIFVFGILIYLFFANVPRQVYPLNGAVVSDANFVFEIENSEIVIIANNPEFANSIVLEENSNIVLPPGKYYWKVKGIFSESEAQTFILQSNVGLNKKVRPDNIEIENAGNVNLEVSRNNEQTTEQYNLEVGEFEEFPKDDSSYEGRQEAGLQ